MKRDPDYQRMSRPSEITAARLNLAHVTELLDLLEEQAAWREQCERDASEAFYDLQRLRAAIQDRTKLPKVKAQEADADA